MIYRTSLYNRSPMQNLKIATAQFEHRSGDKDYNLGVIESLSAQAANEGADVIAFHECSITGYTYARHLSREQLWDLAEPVPDGPSVSRLIRIAKKHRIAVLAGLFEREGERILKTYVCVDENGFVARHRKLHPFINPHLT